MFIQKNRLRTTVAEPIGETLAELPFTGDQAVCLGHEQAGELAELETALVKTETPPEPWIRTVSPAVTPAMARQCYPGGHCSARQGGGCLEGQVSSQKHDCFS